MKKVFGLLTALVLATVVFAGEYPDVSIKDLKKSIEKKEVTVIDVNGTKSYKKGHIPTALNFDEVEKKLASVLPKDKEGMRKA